MNKHNRNHQGGFAHLIVIFIIITVVIATAVLVFLRVRQNDTKPGQNTSSQTNPTPAKTDNLQWSTMSQGPYLDRVSFVISDSLTQWPSEGELLAEHASVPDVILKDDTLYVYFVDVSEDGRPEQIGLLRSSDNGNSWSEKQIITIDGVDDKVAVDPAPYLLPDGRIRLYYFDIGTTRTEGLDNNTIYSAVSSDGINFTQEEGSRFTYPAIFDPDVIKVGDTWRMYVGTDNQKVLSATSTDGLSFTYEGIALEAAAIPNVLYENGIYYLFTGGIEISTSTDSLKFTRTGDRFSTSDPITADPGVVKLSDGHYFMVYKTKN
jgi:hypothetical protein